MINSPPQVPVGQILTPPDQEPTTQSGIDQSSAQASKQKEELFQIQQRKEEQTITHRKWVVILALCFAVTMTTAFLFFTYNIMGNIAKSKIDWHFLLLGSELIIPPTAILFALLRSQNHDGDKGKKDGEVSASSSLARDITSIVSSVAKGLAK